MNHIDSYAIYRLDDVTIRSKAWLTSINLLVLNCQSTIGEESSLGEFLQSFVSNGGRCLSLHPLMPEWMNIVNQESGIVKHVTENGGIFVSAVDKLDEPSALSSVLKCHFEIRSDVQNPKILSNDPQTVYNGYIIAQPFHQEAFFRNIRQPPAELTTIELVKSLHSNSSTNLKIHRNAHPRFNQHNYFDVIISF